MPHARVRACMHACRNACNGSARALLAALRRNEPPAGIQQKKTRRTRKRHFITYLPLMDNFIAGKRGREGMGHGDRPAKDAREQTTDGERAEKALLHLRPNLSIRGRPGPPVTTETYMIM